MFSIRRILTMACLLACARGVPSVLAQGHPIHDTMPKGQKPKLMDGGAPFGISMDRMGSGTTWIPDAVSLPSRHLRTGSWDIMLHGFGFAQYDTQSGPRGDSQIGSLNWGMVMVSRTLAGGRFQARTMLSLDPGTVSRRGYPLLLQSGESFEGERLHDRQHPHDFWMELGVLYERPVTPSIGISLYAAPSGEPALGPVAFMHRPSAMDNLFAPLSHHWQDATHISFGVLTAGLFGRSWKLEGSWFNGREPDDRRWNFDKLRLDSYSGRLTVNPSRHWSLSAGYGYLKSPEALAPDQSMRRVTASVLHGTPLGKGGQWASAVVWGANKQEGSSRLTHALLAETEAILDHSNTVFGRVEYVQKNAEELVLDTPQFGFASGHRFDVASLSAGYIRELVKLHGVTLGVGAMGTLNRVPAELQGAYGSRTPVGGAVFLRLRPVLHGRGMASMGMPMEGAHAAPQPEPD